MSGPEFLQLYWIGLALAVLVAIVVRVRVRAGHSTQPVRSLDMDELAYLAGGPRRVVETAVARLLTAGELRTSRRGTVQVTSTTRSLNPVDRAVVTDCQRYTNRTVNLMIPAVAEDGAVTAIGQRLEAMGLVVNPAVAKSALRKGSIALWVLIVIGFARWVNGLAIGANIGWLMVQLVLTGLLILTLRLTRRDRHIRTRKGDRVLDDARRTSTSAAGSVDEVVYAGAAGAVLFGGLVVYPDLAVRTSLLASSGSGGYSGGSSHSTCSAGSSSCSSGSSCGGGGGGCGGGGGG